MSEMQQESTGGGGDFDLSQFYQIFFEEAGENLDQMEHMLLNLDLQTADDETLNGIFRCAHSIKGGAATFGFSDVAELTHQMESLLDKLKSIIVTSATLTVGGEFGYLKKRTGFALLVAAGAATPGQPWHVIDGGIAHGMVETPMTQGMNQKAKDPLVALVPVGRVGKPAGRGRSSGSAARRARSPSPTERLPAPSGSAWR